MHLRPLLVAPAIAVAVGTGGPVLTAPTSATTLPAFSSSVQRIDDALKERMTYSWRAGCPVKRRDLRYVQVTYLRFDGTARQGELVVHEDEAADVVEVFEAIYAERFPIRRMRLIDDYQGDDDLSMAANNMSAFNCRLVTGGTRWSEHSYGRAIDINPVRNPFVNGDIVAPPAGQNYLDRSPRRKGMVSMAVRAAFERIGWSWGGDWSNLKDYQHFSATGR